MKPRRWIGQERFSGKPRGSAIGLCILLSLAMLAPVTAQSETASPASPAIPAELAGIAGVTGDMSNEDLVALATEVTDQQRLDDAATILIHVARKDPKNYRALEQLGVVYERQMARARANTADPNAKTQAETYETYAVNAYLDAAQQAYEAENYAKAERLCDRIFILQPANTRVQLILARIFASTERSVQASQHYQNYIKSRDGRQDTSARLELARIYRAMRQNYQALAILTEARDLDSENIEVLLELSQAYYERRMFQQAMQTAEDVLRKASNDPRCYDNMAFLLIQQNQVREAAEYSRRAIELARTRVFNNPENTREITSLYGYYDRYRRTLARLLDAKQDDLALRIDLARVVVEQADINNSMTLRNALRLLDQAGPEARDNIKLLETKANIQHLLKLSQTAETARRLLRLDPNNVVARRILQAGPILEETPTTGAGGSGQDPEK